MVRISGAAYEPAVDEDRLKGQMMKVFDALAVGGWWTVEEISSLIDDVWGEHAPEASVSAQIRNLRKRGNGGYRIAGRYRKGLRIYEYRLEGHRSVEGEQEKLEL